MLIHVVHHYHCVAVEPGVEFCKALIPSIKFGCFRLGWRRVGISRTRRGGIHGSGSPAGGLLERRLGRLRNRFGRGGGHVEHAFVDLELLLVRDWGGVGFDVVLRRTGKEERAPVLESRSIQQTVTRTLVEARRTFLTSSSKGELNLSFFVFLLPSSDSAALLRGAGPGVTIGGEDSVTSSSSTSIGDDSREEITKTSSESHRGKGALRTSSSNSGSVYVVDSERGALFLP